jgi:superfamily II DNA or RNA helicase
VKFRYNKDTEELIVSESTRVEYHQISLWLQRKVKGYKFLPAVKMGVWDGNVDFFRSGKINFGLWKECLKACKEIEVPFQIENKEDFPINRNITLEDVHNFCKDFFKGHQVKNKEGNWVQFFPHDHQIETAFKILKNRFCLAEVATSGGKSLIISIVIFYTLKNIKPDAKFLIVVPSVLLVNQFYDGLLEYNYGANTLETIRDKKLEYLLDNKDFLGCDIRVEEIMSERPRKYSGTQNANIYIGTYQSLEKWPDSFFQQFHTVITDEAHGAKATTIKSILERTFTYAYSRFGVSGTFPPDDSCELFTIQSLMGPKITEVSADELKKKGIITPMEVKAVMLNHNDSKYNEKLKIVKKSGDGRTALELEKKYIHASEKRLKFIKKLVDKCDKNTLILFHSIEYGKKVLDYIKDLPNKDFFYIDGEISGKKRNEIKKEMEVTNNNVKVLVASFGTLSTGVSITAIFNVIFVDSFKSESLIIQSIGRALRLHEDKQKAYIFDLVDVFEEEKSGHYSRNILYNQFKEREVFYKKRKYPYTIIKINL